MGIHELRRLGTHLGRLRGSAARNTAEAAAVLGWPTARMVRFEAGLATIRRTDLMELVGFYGADPTPALALLDGTRGWWNRYSDEIDTDCETLLILEDSAASLRTHHAGLVPGLLQTRAYTAALIGTRRDQPWPRLEKLVDLRQERARVLGRGGMEMTGLIDEAALRRPVGGPAVMREQYEHLIAMSRLPGVNVLVRPLTAEPCRAVRFSFHVFDLRVGDDGSAEDAAVQLELLDREHFEWNALEVASYRRAFARAERDALDADASADFLAGLAAAC
ncbi:DUF5753 domain-containing protein [Actinomadura rayongensis]|uniref:DUF5753 domain-containing protein n=1 Tax=Actinomadura rayongensis TaxID=1429076 RepID=A0A6I4W9B4_9ACTN|nr:DUF5753 domain-containing protein [Actinomadura rayongensis]MXQ64865.1 hypothetical protein [Actinomadura rayongensis]